MAYVKKLGTVMLTRVNEDDPLTICISKPGEGEEDEEEGDGQDNDSGSSTVYASRVAGISTKDFYEFIKAIAEAERKGVCVLSDMASMHTNESLIEAFKKLGNVSCFNGPPNTTHAYNPLDQYPLALLKNGVRSRARTFRDKNHRLPGRVEVIMMIISAYVFDISAEVRTCQLRTVCSYGILTGHIQVMGCFWCVLCARRSNHWGKNL